jgi:hypothetical protein
MGIPMNTIMQGTQQYGFYEPMESDDSFETLLICTDLPV